MPRVRASTLGDEPPRAAELLEGARLPLGLQDLAQPPQRLYLHGTWPAGPKVALVGTREPSEAALQFAGRLARELARQGVVVVSGGAIGIDAAAHCGALAARGPTVAVAPCSLDCPYPAEHAELFQRIVRRGAFVSEHERGTVAHPNRFFRRNSLLVALSAVVVIVEAPLRSGARNAAKWARELRRPVLVVPQAPWNPRGRGCIEELRLGAEVLVSYKDVLDVLGRSSSLATSSKFRAALVDGSSRAPTRQLTLEPRSLKPGGGLGERIIAALRVGALDLDSLAERCGCESAALNKPLLDLQLNGSVRRDEAGRYTYSS